MCLQIMKWQVILMEVQQLSNINNLKRLTVQLNLFGGSLIALGTERHYPVLKGIDDLSTIGCFALTELGYGNNAVEMETTATYDSKNCGYILIY